MTETPVPVRVDIDLSQFRAWLRVAPVEVTKAAIEFYKEAATVLEDNIIHEAKTRFGVEMTQSHMQSYDPSRPTGHWAATVHAEIRASEAVVGPDTPYDWWVEEGSNAPPGSIPASHARSQFIGHKPVERGGERSIPALTELAHRRLQEALSTAASSVGGRP